MKLTSALKCLINKNVDENIQDFDLHLLINVQEACEELQLDYNEIYNIEPEISHPAHKSCVRWNFISLSFYILLSLQESLDTLSISQINNIKDLLQFVVSLGLLKHLLPGVGMDLKLRCKNLDKIPDEKLTVKEEYYRLLSTVRGLLACQQSYTLRMAMSSYVGDLLAALFQIVHAPVKKPDPRPKKDGFVMDREFYTEVQANQFTLKLELNKLIGSLHPPLMMQELMMLQGPADCPRWFKKSVFTVLSSKVQAADGVESLIHALTGFDPLDSSARWQQFDMLVRLLMTKPSCVSYEEGYYNNICGQLLGLRGRRSAAGVRVPHYERLIALCIKYLFECKPEVSTSKLLNPTLSGLVKYTEEGQSAPKSQDITDEILGDVNIVHECFVQSTSLKSLPISLLKRFLKLLFYLYTVVHNTSLTDFKAQLSDLLLKYLNTSDKNQKLQVFECFLFVNEVDGVLDLQNIEFSVADDRVKVTPTNTKLSIGPFVTSECVLELLELNAKNDAIVLCLTHLITVLIKQQDDKFDNKTTEYKLVVYKSLSGLIENPRVFDHIKQKPDRIVTLAENLIESKIAKKVHMEREESEEFQLLFVLVVLINIMIENNRYFLKDNGKLRDMLRIVCIQTASEELKALVSSVLNEDVTRITKKLGISKFDLAIADVENVHIPIKAHGLMTLAKLLQEGDGETCKNKNYIFLLCKDHIDHEDSYLYLSAINCLAVFGGRYADLALGTMTEEYLDSNKSCELRMKVGEVLLRIIRALGDKAVDQKTILLNTFLAGAHDEDHLIRASSLSNLGELCKVLGYNLGAIVTEVLDCIHSVISSDSAAEARRAAVSVIRMLFVGLQQETVLFLKDQILPIYRTLKTVYSSDPDGVTRLQAQLALEELNEIMKDFVCPKAKLARDNAMLKIVRVVYVPPRSGDFTCFV